ncbi:11806_t:CDS:2, partial [Gigaspora rosea]
MHNHQTRGHFSPPSQKISIDIVGPLPRTTQGNHYIVVATDYTTKWLEAKPIPTTMDSKQ